MKLNTNYQNLSKSYLFVDIANRISAHTKANPDADIIRLGIGDVTRPLAAPVVKAMVDASKEMGDAATFHGYGPDTGYPFLKEKIAGYYDGFGVSLDLSEIFISDGAKSDCGNFVDLFSEDNVVLVPDPVYPVYVDTNVMAGRKITYVNATKENDFLPEPPFGQHADLIYICSPNNPTGAAYTKTQLAEWVRYAKENDALILFDAAYEVFVTGQDVPHSIYEVEGAKDCAVEICSFSKIAGFTGTRCGYTIVPQDIKPSGQSLNAMWARRQASKYNETSYIIQKAAAEVFTEEGIKACFENVEYYKNNAKTISDALKEVGIWHSGGTNSPYIWMQCPSGIGSWDFFDILLQKGGVVGTPGAGFGNNGEGYFRMSGFGDAQRTKEAAQRLKDVIKNL